MNFEFSYPEILKQSKTMAYLNVISFCLLSGCGSIEMPDEPELNHIYKLLKNTNSTNMPKNITFMSSLYKKCSPVYAVQAETPYDFKGFRWVSKKARKVIEPNVLAHSINCMAALIPFIKSGELQLENPDFVAYCLEINSIKQANFLIDYLKLGDFYYAGEDTGDNEYGEYSIVINTGKIDLRTQLYVIEAISSLAACLNINGQFPKDTVQKLEKCIAALPVICENVLENINELSSRDLAVICLSLTSTLKHAGQYEDIVYKTASSIGFELCERSERTGDISRNMSDDSSSSFVTLCNSLNCLVRLFEINPLSIFESTYLKLYDRIDSYWEAASSLFIVSNKSKQKYALKDITAVFAALCSLRSCLTDPDLYMHVDRQLSSFYNSSFIQSRLFNNQFRPILQENRLELRSMGTAFKNTAPVFAECFEVKTKKKKYYCKPDIFEAEEVLLGCRYLLY